MNSEMILKQVQDIFRDVFDDESLTIGRSTHGADIEDWDSLNHINLVVAVEKQFNFKFDLGEIQTLQNVGEMCDLIVTKISN